jgi:hypothetical protein
MAVGSIKLILPENARKNHLPLAAEEFYAGGGGGDGGSGMTGIQGKREARAYFCAIAS